MYECKTDLHLLFVCKDVFTLSKLCVGQIDPTAFRGLTNLVELDLSGNLLTSVPTPTFSGS